MVNQTNSGEKVDKFKKQIFNWDVMEMIPVQIWDLWLLVCVSGEHVVIKPVLGDLQMCFLPRCFTIRPT